MINKIAPTSAVKETLLDLSNERPISIKRQCELLDHNRSSHYYDPKGESLENIKLMNLIDEKYMECPFYGKRRMTIFLQRMGYFVNIKRVRRLMIVMGIEAIYQKPRLSNPGSNKIKYQYILRGVNITLPDQVWATDITYIRLNHGFCYLTVVLDWATRFIISWSLSTTMESEFCNDCLTEALMKGKPKIFNSDQGSQYTSAGFQQILIDAGVRISLDGRGRAFDNIMVERIWRTIKYEDVYLKRYETFIEAKKGIGEFIKFYNERRPHQELDYQTPHVARLNGLIAIDKNAIDILALMQIKDKSTI